MFMDFVGVCLDPIINQAAKLRYMTAGAFEIPVVVARLAHLQGRRLSAIICLGVILRGATTHAQSISDAVSRALMEIQMSRERAELARQRNELQRLHHEIRHELEVAARETTLRDRLQPFQRRHQELQRLNDALGVILVRLAILREPDHIEEQHADVFVPARRVLAVGSNLVHDLRRELAGRLLVDGEPADEAVVPQQRDGQHGPRPRA